ncbi:hypothetical protein ANO11243_038360 [Dothideomycetidae sp. 11243]|nr:hypothetical protein ANO11243_038360 [fungal sp. No.11243]
MAVQALPSREHFPNMSAYHGMSYSSPTSSIPQASPDMYLRGSFYPNPYQSSQNLYSYHSGYPSYQVGPQTSYNTAPVHHSYPPPLSTQSTPVTMAPHGSHQIYNPSPITAPPSAGPHAMTPVSAASSPTHSKLDYLECHPRTLPSAVDYHQGRRSSSSSSDAEIKSESPSTAQPGPIPATNPIWVQIDQSGVRHIIFEYSRDRVKKEYNIRCDVETVDLDLLTEDFKVANCMYPRANVHKADYKGNRMTYETDCNKIGWQLCKLNPEIRGKRGLIQRAVDSWRNSNPNIKIRSRRVRRQNKLSARMVDRGPSAVAQQSMMQFPPSPQYSVGAYRAHDVMGANTPSSYSYSYTPSVVSSAASSFGGVGGIAYSV